MPMNIMEQCLSKLSRVTRFAIELSIIHFKSVVVYLDESCLLFWWNEFSILLYQFMVPMRDLSSRMLFWKLLWIVACWLLNLFLVQKGEFSFALNMLSYSPASYWYFMTACEIPVKWLSEKVCYCFKCLGFGPGLGVESVFGLPLFDENGVFLSFNYVGNFFCLILFWHTML